MKSPKVRMRLHACWRDENPCAERCLCGFECERELRDQPSLRSLTGMAEGNPASPIFRCFQSHSLSIRPKSLNAPPRLLAG
ncbi:MAG: hypothetical protein EAZ65_04240 [Verrucomicrobia bacterium]|nr:MAG: hypothetical protein EAZ71_04235 [Verrucomicrobiota bacterium]TAF42289.1 MAG: hypothetical protein EAZ65_04240 [Verrucomicrobiota bacterium]